MRQAPRLSTAELSFVQAGTPEPPAMRLSRVQRAFRDRLLGKLHQGIYHLEEVVTCLCGSTAGARVAVSDRFGLPVGIVLCRTCGLLRTTPRLAARDLQAFYESDYHGLHMGIERPDPATSLFKSGQGAAVYRLVKPHLSSPRISIAEIGAGSGSVLLEFREACEADGFQADVVGCEYAPAFVAAGRSMGLDLRQGGVETLAGIDAPDVLILSHVVEHFAEFEKEMRAVRGIVDDRSLVYVEVPGVLTIHTKPVYDYTFGQYFTLAHTYHFTLSTLREAMARGGFAFRGGDEEVRSLFTVGRDATVLPDRALRADRARRYLAWLESSRRLRVMRAATRGNRALRRVSRKGVRVMAGQRGLRLARAIRLRLRGPKR